LKQAAGQAAALLVKDGMTVGLGTGSTVAFLIDEVGNMVKDGLRIKGVSTSFQSKAMCHKAGIPLIDPGMLSKIDLAIDGADEVTRSLDAIKGGGAAHAVEKIIASMADEFVIIADETKLVGQLGLNFPIPVEVMREAIGSFTKNAEEFGANPKIRIGSGKDGPVVTENGNFVIDLYFDAAQDMRRLDIRLKSLPGVIETGLFLGIAKKAIIASRQGIITLTSNNKYPGAQY
jgi:ribose 5-phosphate isomerase A